MKIRKRKAAILKSMMGSPAAWQHRIDEIMNKWRDSAETDKSVYEVTSRMLDELLAEYAKDKHEAS